VYSIVTLRVTHLPFKRPLSSWKQADAVTITDAALHLCHSWYTVNICAADHKSNDVTDELRRNSRN
jgi:hypothetical protein